MTICNIFAGNACKNKHNPQDESLATTPEFLNKMTAQWRWKGHARLLINSEKFLSLTAFPGVLLILTHYCYQLSLFPSLGTHKVLYALTTQSQ